MELLSRQHLGLILVLVGTIFLAFSVQAKSQYNGKLLQELKKAYKNLFVPTETVIIRPRFWGGLALIAAGSMLQW